jgi:hypothetical protein
MTSTEAAATIQVIGACEQALVSLRNLYTKPSPKESDDRIKDRQVQKLLAAVQENLKVLEQKKVRGIGNKVDDLRQLTRALAPNDDNTIAHTRPGNLLAKQAGAHATYTMDGTGTLINNPAVYCEDPSGMWRLIFHNANLNANFNRETSEKRLLVGIRYPWSLFEPGLIKPDQSTHNYHLANDPLQRPFRSTTASIAGSVISQR